VLEINKVVSFLLKNKKIQEVILYFSFAGTPTRNQTGNLPIGVYSIWLFFLPIFIKK